MSQKGFLFDSGDAICILPLSRMLRWMKESTSVFFVNEEFWSKEISAEQARDEEAVNRMVEWWISQGDHWKG